MPYMRCSRCNSRARFIVNGLHREAQSVACAVHLARVVTELSEFNDERYKRRHPDDKHAGTVYLLRTEQELAKIKRAGEV